VIELSDCIGLVMKMPQVYALCTLRYSRDLRCCDILRSASQVRPAVRSRSDFLTGLGGYLFLESRRDACGPSASSMQNPRRQKRATGQGFVAKHKTKEEFFNGEKSIEHESFDAGSGRST